MVLINGEADPPVVRLIEFSKYKYDMEKTAKQKQKASKRYVGWVGGVVAYGGWWWWLLCCGWWHMGWWCVLVVLLCGSCVHLYFAALCTSVC